MDIELYGEVDSEVVGEVDSELYGEVDGEVRGTKCGRGFVIVLVWAMANSHSGGAFVSASS